MKLGFHLHRYLIQNNVNNIVVHPASIEVSSRDRVKTDKRDALKIALQLSAHHLRGVFVPEQEQEAKRMISRLRTSFWRLHQRVGVQLKSLLFTQGIIKKHDDTRVCQKWINQKLVEIDYNNYPKDFVYSVKAYAKEWTELTLKLKDVEAQLKVQSENERDLLLIYENVPGIGLIHAKALANELGDMSQFSNEKKLFSYTELTPREYFSGEHIRQCHITRQGRPILRKILIEASWVAITKDQSLSEVYNRLSHRGGKRAIVGVARRLVGRIRSCLLRGIPYEIAPSKTDSVAQKMICATS